MKRLLIIAALLFPARIFAATAAPVAVSTIGVTGSTVTVTTGAAHGLSATLPNGFCISGSSVNTDNVCGVVLTSATGTTFTFSASGLSVCASSCGTILPAKKIIWQTTQTVSGGYQVNYLLWLTTINGVKAAVSSWSGASAAENTALSSGQFIEVQRSKFWPLGTTLATVQLDMVNDWTTQQNLQTAAVQPGAFFGDFYDTGWLQ